MVKAWKVAFSFKNGIFHVPYHKSKLVSNIFKIINLVIKKKKNYKSYDTLYIVRVIK